ncbi:hypothetical protein KSS87_006810 [Heliosperma pusillum]|nr:hypothetical protein KSS87_006810 [Heliosperma pusillum]
MAAPVPPGAHRPNNQQSSAPPPNYVPNQNRAPNPSSLQNFQNLQINNPQNAPVLSSARPPFAGAPRFPSSVTNPPTPSTGPSSVSRPGPPPPGVVPRAAAPPAGPMVQPSMMPGRPSGAPPFVQPQPFASRPLSQGPFPSGGSAPPPAAHASNPTTFQGGPRPGVYGSPPMSSGSINQPTYAPSARSNGPPVFSAGTVPGGPRFPPPGGSQQPPPGPPLSVPLMRAPAQPPTMRSILGAGAVSSSGDQPASPYSLSPQGPNAPLHSGSPFGLQPPQAHMRQVAPPPLPGSMQPPMMYGMPPTLPPQNMGNAPMGQPGAPMAGSSKIDPNQIPRPLPSSSAVVYETRTGSQANIPPVSVFLAF